MKRSLPPRLIRRRRRRRHPPRSLIDFVLDLPRIVREADERRLSVAVDQFREEYPDFYEFAEECIDLAPGEAKARIIERWPSLSLLRLHPAADNVIAAIQRQIKIRREKPE